MKTEIINTELTGSTKYYAIDATVDGKYSLGVTVIETYDGNPDYTHYETEITEWGCEEPEGELKNEIEKAAKEAAIAHVRDKEDE